MKTALPPEFKKEFYNEILKTTLCDKAFCYWYPLTKIKPDIPALAFSKDFWDNETSMNRLKSILHEIDIKEVIFIPEFDAACVYNSSEEFFDEFFIRSEEFIYDYDILSISECFFCDSSREWLIYCSHEHTITFAGKRLVDRIQKLPDYIGGLCNKFYAK